MLNFGIIADLFWGAHGDDTAAVKHHHTVGIAKNNVHVMLREQDANLLVVDNPGNYLHEL